MSKLFKTVFTLLLLWSFSFSTMAYTTQFADQGETVQLRWKNAVIPITLSTSLTKQNLNIKNDSDVIGAVRRSLETWEKAAAIKFDVTTSDKQSASPAGKSGDGISLITIAQTPENLLLFAGDTEDVSARTRIFYNGKGSITEADIVLNPYQQFSTDGSIGTFDLEATLTHELGHLLGLDHSTVIGATMFVHQGKNGVYNLSAFSSRTLAEDDISGIRALYGTNKTDDNCCGTISGKLTPTGKSNKVFQVWAEESETGRIFAGVLTNSDGSFRIEGLPAKDYKVYAREFADEKFSVSDDYLGQIAVSKGKTANIQKRLVLKGKNFDLQYLGFNGQISELAVPLSGGKSFTVYVGGKNFDVENLTVGFNSPFLSVTPNSLVKHNYGEELSVFSFEIKVNPKTPAGEYSFFVQDKNGETAYFIGGLTVEEYVNPWSSYFLPEN